MKTFVIKTLSVLIVFGCSLSVCGELQARGNSGPPQLKVNKGFLKIEVVNDNILHLTFAHNKGYVSHSKVVLKQYHPPRVLYKTSKKPRSLRTSRLICELPEKSGKLIIKDTSGLSIYLEAIIPGEIHDTVIREKKTYSIRQTFIIDPGEGLYGLGSQTGGLLNLHMRSQGLMRENLKVDIPFVVSTRNYGIFWDNPSSTGFQSSETEMSFCSESADAIDFYIITGNNADEVIAAYRQLTGQVPMLPRLAFGFLQTGEKNKSPDEVRHITKEYRSRNIPMDVSIQDTCLPDTARFYDNPLKTSASKRGIILSRSSWPGQQRIGAITCQGDVPSDFKTLKQQPASAVNFGMSGNPYWSPDIGGSLTRVRGDEYPMGIADLAWCELYIRWFQFAAFCPVFRSPANATGYEIWKFGEKGSVLYETLLQWVEFRYRILPYIYSLAWKMHADGYTLMRGLAMDFKADTNVYHIGDQYMFGPAFLLKPVTEQQYFRPRHDTATEQQNLRVQIDSIDFYLPAGSAWYDFYTGKRFEGGQTILTPSPLEVIPAFIRAGSIVPYGPMMQYAGEKPSDPVDLRIYPGADGDFVLYEDENDGYNYENGAYSLIPIHWNDKEQTVTIGRREGEFPGILRQRSFRVVLISPAIPDGFMEAGVTQKSFKYYGSEISVKIK
jgi:alpha-glucosidase (family GH31 glycosyl hydrolase)